MFIVDKKETKCVEEKPARNCKSKQMLRFLKDAIESLHRSFKKSSFLLCVVVLYSYGTNQNKVPLRIRRTLVVLSIG